MVEAYSKGNCIRFGSLGFFLCQWSSSAPLSADYAFTVHIFFNQTNEMCSRSVAEFLWCTFQVCKTWLYSVFFLLLALATQTKLSKISIVFRSFQQLCSVFWPVSKGISSEKKFKTKRRFQLFEITRMWINSNIYFHIENHRRKKEIRHWQLFFYDYSLKKEYSCVQYFFN